MKAAVSSTPSRRSASGFQHAGIAHTYHRRAQGGQRHLRPGLHMRPLGRQIHADRTHTRHAAQDFFHPGHTAAQLIPPMASNPSALLVHGRYMGSHMGTWSRRFTLDGSTPYAGADKRLVMSKTTLKFDLPDMVPSCVRSITAAVPQVDAKAKFFADLESKRVAVSGTGSAAAFAAAIENAGFTARPSNPSACPSARPAAPPAASPSRSPTPPSAAADNSAPPRRGPGRCSRPRWSPKTQPGSKTTPKRAR